jgi:hypothetical protein
MSRIVECPHCGHHLAVPGSQLAPDPAGADEADVFATGVTDLNLPFEPPDDEDDDLCHATVPEFREAVIDDPVAVGLAPDDTVAGFLGSAIDPLMTPDPDHARSLRDTVVVPPPPSWIPADSSETQIVTTPPPPSDAAVAPEAARPRPGAGSGGLGKVLLASYASALTLACGWLIWDRGVPPGRRGPADSPSYVTQARAASGRGAVEPPPRVVDPVEVPSEDRIIAIGQSLRVGGLEIAALGVETASIDLVNVGIDGSRNIRPGGSDAILLRLRLRNLSETEAFTPLSRNDVRLPDEGLPSSILEVDDGTRIYPYPLPVESDWSVMGQRLGELRPGESVETILVSDAGALSRLGASMTWLVRMRTGAADDDIRTVGVRFLREELR